MGGRGPSSTCNPNLTGQDTPASHAPWAPKQSRSTLGRGGPCPAEGGRVGGLPWSAVSPRCSSPLRGGWEALKAGCKLEDGLSNRHPTSSRLSSVPPKKNSCPLRILERELIWD